jgi:hypothetical protein
MFFLTPLNKMRTLVGHQTLVCDPDVQRRRHVRFITNPAYTSPKHTALAWSGISLAGISITLFIVALLLSLRR